MFCKSCAGGGVVACMSILRHSYRDSVVLETKSLSFEGHLEKKLSIFLVIKSKQRCFGSVSTMYFSAGDGAQRCRGNWSKTGHQPNMGPTVTCSHLQHISKLT